MSESESTATRVAAGRPAVGESVSGWTEDEGRQHQRELRVHVSGQGGTHPIKISLSCLCSSLASIVSLLL